MITGFIILQQFCHSIHCLRIFFLCFPNHVTDQWPDSIHLSIDTERNVAGWSERQIRNRGNGIASSLISLWDSKHKGISLAFLLLTPPCIVLLSSFFALQASSILCIYNLGGVFKIFNKYLFSPLSWGRSNLALAPSALCAALYRICYHRIL